MLVLKLYGAKQYYAILHNQISFLNRRTSLTFKKRMALYRMLEKMTGEPASLQINEAITELQMLEVKHDLKTPLWYMHEDVIEQMRNSDADFSQAMAKYIPQQDTMIIAAAEEDDITLGFTTVIENNKKTQEMRTAFISALAYPVFLIITLLGILYYFSTSLIPSLVQAVPDGAQLSWLSRCLVALADGFMWWFPLLSLFIICLVGFTIWALPNLTLRQRKYLENLPPFNMYRIMVGCGFLFALNSLGRAGFMQIDALEEMVSLSRPYLRYRILVIMELMADGMDVGQALIHSELDFPDKDMVRELAIQIKYSEDDSLEILSNTLAADGLETIKRQARFLNVSITMFIFATIGFLYMGVYGLGQDLGGIQSAMNY